jgi:hypothetical protein
MILGETLYRFTLACLACEKEVISNPLHKQVLFVSLI